MKKMLVLFLILFTKVLADSEEDKYVDLLPDEEKQQFLEKVARRILKDVESQENVTDAQSGELSDEQLKQHTEYVQAVLKEEQENIRRSKGDNDQEEKPASDETEALGVQPLRAEKMSLPDLTLREERRDTASDESTKNNITIEMVTDNVPIIKRSVQEDNAGKSYESDETTSETLYRVTQTNITSEESNEVEATNEKVVNDEVANEAKVLFGKVSKVNVSTIAGDENDESESVDSKQSIPSKSSANNVSVKGINELLPRRSNSNDRTLAGNTTESNTSTSIVVGVKSMENKSNQYNNVSSADEEFTNLTYPFVSSSIKDTTSESTTSDSPLPKAIITTNKGKDFEQLQKSTNFISHDIENGVGTATESTQTTAFADKETTVFVPATTEFAPETTKLAPETTTNTDITTSEAVMESTTVLVTTEKTNTPVVMTENTKKNVENFTSAPTITTSAQSTTFKPRKTTKNMKKPVFKQRTLSEELTTMALGSDEESIEATTKKIIKHKVIVHKAHKYIIGPKAKKIAEAEIDRIQNKNFIELEKRYYDNNYNVQKEKQYHVFEIPADKSPFIKDEEPIADQPYYVPIYNYSPNNAYFNPKNRLGPNAGDSSETNNAIFNDDDDDINQLDKTETLNVKMEYGRMIGSKRKKFGSKQKLSHNIHKQPLHNNEQYTPRGHIKPEDFYFGRVREELARRVNMEDLAKFPNSDETDHPAHSIQEGSLKDHVRAVRNILFQQKSFGLLEKDKYGENVVNELRIGRTRSEAKQGLRNGQDDDLINTNDFENINNDKNKHNIAIDYYFGRENPTILKEVNQDGINDIHIQKVGYLKKKNGTKELYVMDDFFKANVEKYIEENRFTPAPQPLYQATTTTNLDKKDKVIAYLRQEARMNKLENANVNSLVKSDLSNNEEITTATQNKDDIPVNTNEISTTEKVLDVKLNLRRNDVIKVSVYLQVLKDMVTLDNKALVQYDWLGTTVDIQAALQKLFELTALVANKEQVHPADMEILKYVIFLNQLATEIIEANDVGTQLRKKLALPRNKKLKPRLLTDKGLINRVWLYLRKDVPQVNEYRAVKHLNKFLIGVEDGLYDLHDAIKNIAKITKYRNQHWYQNLKDLYINTDEKHLLELLLHMTSLRLFTLIEESAKNGLEDDYIKYMKQNRKHSKRTLEEMMFIMELLEEYNKFVE